MRSDLCQTYFHDINEDMTVDLNLYFPMQNIILTPICHLVSIWYIMYYKVLSIDKSSFGGTD